MNILFMIDHGNQSGSGHLIRSGQVINSLINQKQNVFAVLENYYEKKIKSTVSEECRFINIDEDFSQLTIQKIQNLVNSFNAEVLVIDSYKIDNNILPTNDSLKIYRIIDKELTEKIGVKYLPIGIRFPQDLRFRKTLVDYPIRDLSDVEDKTRSLNKRDKLLVYLGTSPSGELIEGFINLILELGNEIKNAIVFYLPLETLGYYQNKYPLFFVSDIDLILPETKLLMGSASSIIYEICFLDIPMITIALNETQVNSDSELANLGLFMNFHVNEILQNNQFIEFTNLIWKDENLAKFSCPGKSKLNLKSADYLAAKILGREESFSNLEPSTEPPSMGFRKTEASDLSKLREWRNKESVRERMANSREITKLEHYNWWITNTRNNYIFEINSESVIYIWHEKIKFKSMEFLIGGWIPLRHDVNISDILYCLKWQLNKTGEDYSTVPWLAVIKKDNLVPNFLNSRLGFESVPPGSFFHEAALKVFNIENSFDYYNILKF